MNLTPDQYRNVAVSEVDFDLHPDALEQFFTGREVYRRTSYIVVISGDDTALIAVDKASEEPLFSPVTRVELVASPEETVLVRDPDLDTGIPSNLAAVAHREAPGRRCVVVVGAYEHVSFIVDPQPLEIVIRDVTPPHPAKLLNQAQRIIDVSEDLPPIRLIADIQDLDALIVGDGPYLLPCAGAASDRGRADISYLDQRPPKRDWTLIGCTRSQQIHTWFYGEAAPIVDFCPKRRPAPDGAVILTKCCLLESGMEVRSGTVYVPWGSTLDGVRAGLEAAVALAGSASRSPRAEASQPVDPSPR